MAVRVKVLRSRADRAAHRIMVSVNRDRPWWAQFINS